jgi:hypothetical protein
MKLFTEIINSLLDTASHTNPAFTFAPKAGANPGGANPGGVNPGGAYPTGARIYKTRMNVMDGNKHSSLLSYEIRYDNTGPSADKKL